ncbi:uncharacterized protein [Nicotiana tomentosiformis]|uniref:uncharacterized protein n=1 Tax=Nicotiana tomentosiformis TaxID=4098 RepID=UPI00388C3D89
MECHLLSRPVELANYMKSLASKNDKKKIHSLSGECILNNVMHNAATRDELFAKRNQLVARLSVLDAKTVEIAELEAQLQQSEQEAMAHSQEATQVHAQLQDVKARWDESQDVALAAIERESASIKPANNLEAALNSKAEEVASAEEKRARMEDRYKKIMDKNRVHISTICDLDLSLGATRSERDGLLAEVDRLNAKLQHQGDSLIFKKTYSTHHMMRKTLDEAKMDVIDTDDESTKARALELTARECLPGQADAIDSSSTGSEYSGIEEELEEDADEGQYPAAAAAADSPCLVI